MRTHIPTERLLDEAEATDRCAIGGDDGQRRSLKRRHASGLLVSPYRNVYARTTYWASLTPIQRHLHVARAVALLHPDWTFAGLTAACAHGFEHSYSMHNNSIIYITSDRADGSTQHRSLRRIQPQVREKPIVVNGVRVTDAQRTLVDCAQLYSFQEMLPMADSAARRRVDMSRLPALCHELGRDSAAVVRLCKYADPLSENGGESLARAVMIEFGFMVPQLQREFPNPVNLEASYRTDFMWELPNGAIIVGEYDGMGKYAMADARRSTIQAKVHAERERETHLMAQGVTRIVRFEYEDLVHPGRLERKLVDAGVPKRHQTRASSVIPQDDGWFHTGE